MTNQRTNGRKLNGHGRVNPDEPAQATLIAVILDRSGSMGICRDATIAGFNQFLQSQRDVREGGRALVSLTQFNHHYEVNFVGEPIENVPALDTQSYVPQGRTALHDAIGRTIHEVEAWVREHDWQERVLILIITDGQENASREYDLHAVHALIEGKEREGWNVAYMGANQDSYAVGGAMGVRSGFTKNYTQSDTGVRDNFTDLADKARTYRLAKLKGLAAQGFFDAQEQPKAEPPAGRLVPKTR